MELIETKFKKYGNTYILPLLPELKKIGIGISDKPKVILYKDIMVITNNSVNNINDLLKELLGAPNDIWADFIGSNIREKGNESSVLEEITKALRDYTIKKRKFWNKPLVRV